MKFRDSKLTSETCFGQMHDRRRSKKNLESARRGEISDETDSFCVFSNQEPISEIAFGEDREIPCDLNVVTVIYVNEDDGTEYYLTQN